MAENTPPLSASQIDLFLACQRKWFYKYIENRPNIVGKGAILGSAVHVELEQYLKGYPINFTTDAGYIALSLTQLAPSPTTPGLQAEKDFSFQYDGVTYRGKKDFGYQREDGWQVVGDFKTTSDLKYAKTSEDLATDTQAMLYAYEAYLRNPTAKGVTLEWLYAKTDKKPTLNIRPRKTQKVHLNVLKEDTEMFMVELNSVAKEILKLYDEPNRKNALKNPGHCRAYNGCPYLDICDLTFEESLQATLMSDNTPSNSLIERLKARKLLGQIAKSTVNPPEFQPDNSSVWEEPEPAPVEPEPVLEPEPAPSEDAEPEPAPISTVRKKRAPRVQANVRAKSPVPPAQETTDYATLELRTLAAKPMSDSSSEEGQFSRLFQAITQAQREDMGMSPSKEPNDGKFSSLYLFCTPLGKKIMSFEDLLQRATSKMAEAGYPDYRLVDYGKGAAHLLACFQAALLEVLSPELEIVCLHDSNELKICLPLLRTSARTVVMGVR